MVQPCIHIRIVGISICMHVANILAAPCCFNAPYLHGTFHKIKRYCAKSSDLFAFRIVYYVLQNNHVCKSKPVSNDSHNYIAGL